MKSQATNPAVVISAIVSLIAFFAFLALFTPILENLTGCEEAKNQLTECQNSLTSCQNDLKQSLSREESIKSQLETCQSTINSLNQTLSICQTDLTKCKTDLNSSLQEIGRLSGCCNKLETCTSELEECKLRDLITKENVEVYSILIENTKIKLTTFVTILVIPIALSLIDFTLVSVKVLVPAWVSKVISFLKISSALISIAFLISFWFRVPVEVSILVSIAISGIIGVYVFLKEED